MEKLRNSFYLQASPIVPKGSSENPTRPDQSDAGGWENARRPLRLLGEYREIAKHSGSRGLVDGSSACAIGLVLLYPTRRVRHTMRRRPTLPSIRCKRERLATL